MLGIGNRSIVKMSIGFLGGFELVHDSLIGFLVIEDANLVMGYRGQLNKKGFTCMKSYSDQQCKAPLLLRIALQFYQIFIRNKCLYYSLIVPIAISSINFILQLPTSAPSLLNAHTLSPIHILNEKANGISVKDIDSWVLRMHSILYTSLVAYISIVKLTLILVFVNMETQSDLFKKLKLNQITHHLFIHEAKVDYLLLLSTKYQLILYTFKNAYFELVTTYSISPVNPIALSLGIHGQILLLHSTGIFVWTLTQIKFKCHPQKLRIQSTRPPLKILPLTNEHFAIVCQKNLIMIVNPDGQQNFICHGELNLKQLQYSGDADNLLTLVPSKTNRFPYLFSMQEVMLWNKTGFIESYIKYCSNYYEKDQVLPHNNTLICFSAQQNMAFIFLKEELIVLHAKKRVEEIAYVFSIRLKIRTKWGDSHLFCTISPHNGRIAYIGKERVGQILPLEYRSIRKSIKQKIQSPINYAYYLMNNLMLLLSHTPQSNSLKVYMHQFDDLS